MYEWAEAESDWANLFASSNFFGLGEKINSALGNVSQNVSDWANGLKDLHIGTKVAQFLNGIFSDREAFENAGKAVGDALTTLTQAVSDFIRDFKWEDAVEAMRSFMDGFIKAIEGEEGINRWETLEKVRVFFESFLEVFKASTWKSTFLDVKIAFMEGFVGIQESIVDFLRFMADHPVLSMSILGIPASTVKEELDTLNAGLEGSKEALQEAKIAQAELALETGKSLTVAQEMLLGIRDETGALTEYGKELKGVKDKTDKLAEATDNLDGKSAEVTISINTPNAEVDSWYSRIKQRIFGKTEEDPIDINLDVQNAIHQIEYEIASAKYKVDIDPNIENPIDSYALFKNGGDLIAYGGGGGGANMLRMPIRIKPELGDTTEFNSTMDRNVTKTTNPWQAKVNPIYNSAQNFWDTMKMAITGSNVFFIAKVNAIYNSGQDFWYKMNAGIIGPNVHFGAKVNAVYNSGQDFWYKMNAGIIGPNVFFGAKVNPVYKSSATYTKEMNNATKDRTVSVSAKLTNSDNLTKSIKDAVSGISIKLKTTVNGKTSVFGKLTTAEYAQGGFPEAGELFIARESGPELVGTMGGNTAVANNNQIVAGIQSGVAQANAEQNELLRQQNSILAKLLNKELTINPSVALGQVVARSTAMYGRA